MPPHTGNTQTYLERRLSRDYHGDGARNFARSSRGGGDGR